MTSFQAWAAWDRSQWEICYGTPPCASHRRIGGVAGDGRFASRLKWVKGIGPKRRDIPVWPGGQNYWAFPVCVPYLLSEYRFGQKYTSQYDFTGHLPPGCADYRCTSRGYCIS